MTADHSPAAPQEGTTPTCGKCSGTGEIEFSSTRGAVCPECKGTATIQQIILGQPRARECPNGCDSLPPSNKKTDKIDIRAEIERAVKSFTRYDYSDAGMMESEFGRWVESARLPEAFAVAIGHAALTSSQTDSSLRAAEPPWGEVQQEVVRRSVAEHAHEFRASSTTVTPPQTTTLDLGEGETWLTPEQEVARDLNNALRILSDPTSSEKAEHAAAERVRALFNRLRAASPPVTEEAPTALIGENELEMIARRAQHEIDIGVSLVDVGANRTILKLARAIREIIDVRRVARWNV